MKRKIETAADRKAAKKKARRAELRVRHAYVADPTRPKRKKRGATPKRMLPFVGCDGEGIGKYADHKYVLMRIGEKELYKGGRRLRTPELLEFILTAPEQASLTAFAFEYDISGILRDLSPERMKRLLKREVQGRDPNVSNPFQGTGWTYLSFEGYPEFGVDYIPRNYLSVCRMIRVTDAKGVVHLESDKSSIRTIFDSFTFFQCSFLKALAQWEIGTPEIRAAIKVQKDNRENFTTITQEIRDYCRTECELLAEMMEKFRAMCVAVDIVPGKWSGAGKLASAMFKKHGVITREKLEKITRANALKAFHAAYYGGRFETPSDGEIRFPVIESDISSAYPAAMKELPCLVHGKWHKCNKHEMAHIGKNRPNALFCATVKFTHPPDQFLCGLPIRTDAGRLIWPQCGSGTYWSPEIRSAQRLGARIQWGEGWLYEKRCDCQMFDWVETLYEERRRIGKAGKGIVIKLALNALAGKWAQRIGAAPYLNPIYGGLVTAITRAKLNDAIASMDDQRRVVMIATDALYTIFTAPKVPYGPKLGEWERKDFPDGIFICKPGIWWPPKTPDWKLKTRGLTAKFFEEKTGAFEREWRKFADHEKAQQSAAIPQAYPGGVPRVELRIDFFIGIRLAFHRKAYETAGTWSNEPRVISFKWWDKRGGGYDWIGANGCWHHIRSRPFRGSTLMVSKAYDVKTGLGELGDALLESKFDFEAMPDWVELDKTNQL